MSWKQRRNPDEYLLVCFVDVASSVALYRQEGDIEASAAVGRALNGARSLADDNGGRMVKRSGDELLVVFDEVNAGLDALLKTQQRATLELRIGAHWGPVLWQGGDAYGDTVNLAARLTAIARARQIVLSRPMFDALDTQRRSRCERFERLRIRGMDEPMSIYQLRWEGADATQLNTLDATSALAAQALTLHGPTGTLKVCTDAGEGPDTTIGRDPSCDLVIDHPRVSRFHATVEIHHGRFVLRDHSTNGSVLESGNAATGRALRRSAAPMPLRGAVRLGHTSSAMADSVKGRTDVRFEIS